MRSENSLRESNLGTDFVSPVDILNDIFHFLQLGVDLKSIYDRSFILRWSDKGGLWHG